MTRRICIDGVLNNVVGTMTDDVGAAKMTEAFRLQTGKKATWVLDPENHLQYLVVTPSDDQNIVVKCNLCHCSFELPYNTAMKMSANNSGNIPCEKCGSYATHWSLNK